MPDKDMLRMQEEARRRVMEMQNRSRFFMQDMEARNHRPPAPGPSSEKADKNKESPPQTSDSDAPSVREGTSPGISAAHAWSGSALSLEDDDRLLVLSLLMLLKREKADRRLLLALMYIAGGG